MQTGLAGFPGLGIQLGMVDAHSLYTREVNIVADFKPAGSRGSVVVAATLGGAIRLLGIERTIGNAAYRGYDLDLGLRVGPGLVFQVRETRASKNKRFDLFLEPFLRFSSRRGEFVWFLEAGTHRPVARAGLWLVI